MSLAKAQPKLGDWVTYLPIQDDGHNALAGEKQLGQLVEQHFEGKQLVNMVQSVKGFNERVYPQACWLEKRGHL